MYPERVWTCGWYSTVLGVLDTIVLGSAFSILYMYTVPIPSAGSSEVYNEQCSTVQYTGSSKQLEDYSTVVSRSNNWDSCYARFSSAFKAKHLAVLTGAIKCDGQARFGAAFSSVCTTGCIAEALERRAELVEQKCYSFHCSLDCYSVARIILTSSTFQFWVTTEAAPAVVAVVVVLPSVVSRIFIGIHILRGARTSRVIVFKRKGSARAQEPTPFRCRDGHSRG